MEALEFIKERLDDCLAHHKTCSSPNLSKPSWYPTRLIHVQKGRNTVNLIETAETPISEPYASLSHCWGKSKILRLTIDDLASFKSGISFSLLPKTFQEAIQVVKSLGLSYVWIDSLCIIQDSDQDWRREAHTMLNVYRHALCNIAATRSSNSYGGLFADREPSRLGSGAIDINNGALKGRFHLIDEEYFIQEIDDAPLNRRAWVTQERLLSSRIIHFASEQVFWDCSELTACEALPEQEGAEAWPRSSTTRIGCKKGSQFLNKPDSIDQGLSQWARIVNTYSDSGLTVVGDKFIAISGLAEHLRSELKLDYHAGLWSSRMEVQLAWHVTKSQPERSPRNDLAPTWSWASVNGSVSMLQVDLYDGYELAPLASIVQVKEEKRQDLQGRGEKILSSLSIRCSLTPIEIDGDPRDPQLKGDGMEHAGRVFIDSSDVVGAEGLFFLPLFEIQMRMSMKEEWKMASEMTALVVQSIQGEPGTYTRCGRAVISSNIREDTRAYDPSFEAVKSPKGKSGVLCKEYDPDVGHLITLI